jgi:hypothetical protein
MKALRRFSWLILCLDKDAGQESKELDGKKLKSVTKEEGFRLGQ